jgi:hypothetical protein
VAAAIAAATVRMPVLTTNVLGVASPTSCNQRKLCWCSLLQCALLANAAGIGGGPFYVPLFNSVLVRHGTLPGSRLRELVSGLKLASETFMMHMSQSRWVCCYAQGFDLKLCTGLSHSVVATGAIGSCIYGLLQWSPVDRKKTLLNFDIALTLIPAMLFGVSFVSGGAALSAPRLIHVQQHAHLRAQLPAA